ncbi:MAG TPA: winged helix-turn-helix domain-containing protein [Streptosporangiaceae bacterium]|nr:winged helix-turn-helix domain-containing protein [Streptosporangiaceae bacterium]
MSPGDAAAENQLLYRSRPPDHSDAGPALPWDEQVPPPGRDATLLAVVPIPGTGTSLAIVGYAITTSAADPAAQPAPAARPPSGNPASPGHGLFLDHAQRRVWIDGREVQLAFQEFELLAFLAAHPAIVFTRAELVERVWHRTLGQDGRPLPRDSRTVDVHVSRLRRKLGPCYGVCLVTEYRVGYQYRPRPA